MAAGKKSAQGAKKAAPPGKGKRKPGQTQGGKPGSPTRPKSQGGQKQQRPAGQQGKPCPTGAKPSADKPAGDKPSGGSSASGGDQGSNTSAGGPADE